MKNVQNALRKVLVPLNHFVHRIVLLIAQISMMAIVAIVTLDGRAPLLLPNFGPRRGREEVPRLLVTLFAFIIRHRRRATTMWPSTRCTTSSRSAARRARRSTCLLTDVVVLLCGLFMLTGSAH